jgi:hypothetical protein
MFKTFSTMARDLQSHLLHSPKPNARKPSTAPATRRTQARASEAQARSTREILLGCCSRLGAGYGDTAQQALSHGRELRFLLDTSADYDRLEPYVERALTPSTEAESTRAVNEYLDQNDNIRTGLLRISIVHSDKMTRFSEP